MESSDSTPKRLFSLKPARPSAYTTGVGNHHLVGYKALLTKLKVRVYSVHAG